MGGKEWEKERERKREREIAKEKRKRRDDPVYNSVLDRVGLDWVGLRGVRYPGGGRW